MLKKSYSKTGRSCRVTFKVPPPVEADQVALVGEFNEWEPEAHRLKKRKDGSFSLTVSLDSGRDYRFRYLVDGEVWTNDDEPDKFVPNRYGSADGVVAV
ncbi:MAG: isoamylase early set domain-containing protein [Acidobacteriota bacterium]